MRCAFTGDLSLTGVFHRKASQDIQIFSDGILDLFSHQHYVICNLEGPALPPGTQLETASHVINPSTAIPYLMARGTTVFNLGNNHMFDLGLPGFTHTRNDILRHNGFYFGAGEDLGEAARICYLRNDNVILALIGASHREGLLADATRPGVLCPDTQPDLLRDLISEARKTAHWVILSYHGGEEFNTVPAPRRRKLMWRFVDCGVDIVVGHHSHVVQGIEQCGDKTVFFSLGNFVFDLPCHHHRSFTHEGLIPCFEFTPDTYDFSLMPTAIDIAMGIVNSGNHSLLARVSEISDFNNYRHKFLADAYRTICQSQDRQSPAVGMDTAPLHQPHRYNALAKALLRRNTYTTIVKILCGGPKRYPLIFAAVEHFIRKLFPICRNR